MSNFTAQELIPHRVLYRPGPDYVESIYLAQARGLLSVPWKQGSPGTLIHAVLDRNLVGKHSHPIREGDKFKGSSLEEPREVELM